jgi:predicted RNase H-like HicB family nuclease
MKVSKLLLAVVGAAVLLAALVASASARSLESSSQTSTVLWRRTSFAVSGETLAECEIKLSGSLHARTFAKTVGSLIGYITESVVLRCARGGMTINQASLPWHRRYRAFAGTLPNILTQSETISGAEWAIREAFGLTCTVRRESSELIRTYTLSSGTVTGAEVTGHGLCLGLEGALSGSETNVTNGSGARLTLRLI